MAADRAAVRIDSRRNPVLVSLRRLVRDGSAYRRGGPIWIEGEHLCAAAMARRVAVRQALLTDEAWARPGLRELAGHAERVAVVPAGLLAECATLESPAPIGFLLDRPPSATCDPACDAVVLDRVQDAGNVGSILRTAAALGVPQVLAIKGTAALWSPKALRSGMGAHFGLRLIEGLDEQAVLSMGLGLVATTSHGGDELHRARLPDPAAWLLGHEGQGISPTLLAGCAAVVRIPQPGGEDSLNVAAAAAICLYEALRRRQ